MKFIEKNPPRSYSVGKEENNITIHDCGEVFLEANEQVTFKTESEKEYDVARKDWGFYATPSLNSRLKNFNLRSVLVKNQNSNNYFVLLVEEGKEDIFNKYLAAEDMKIVTWLDNDDVLSELEEKMKDKIS